MRRRGRDYFAGEGGDTVVNSERHATGTENRQQSMNSLKIKGWQKARRKWRLDGVACEGGDTGTDSGRHVTGTENRQQAMDSPELEGWRKSRRKKICKMS